MAETIRWLYSVRAEGGPSVALDGHVSVDGYEKLSVNVPAATAVGVTLGPGTWTDIQCLVVSAGDMSGTLTVEPDGAAAVPLDAPIVLLGPGAVALLGGGNSWLNLNNTGAADVLVDIFVARDATP
jgi:hypothetical protein